MRYLIGNYRDGLAAPSREGGRMKKLKFDTSQTWIVRRMGKVYRVCAEDGSDMAKVSFASYEQAREFADEANAMKVGR